MDSDSAVFCVANTHLLFNPKAGEVKLAQLSYLLAELHKLALKPGTQKLNYTLGGYMYATIFESWKLIGSIITGTSLQSVLVQSSTILILYIYFRNK